MKRSENYVLRHLEDEVLLIPRGKKAEEINGVLTLSETAAFIYNHIEDTKDTEALADLIGREYHVGEAEKEEIRTDIQEILCFFYDYGIMEEKR